MLRVLDAGLERCLALHSAYIPVPRHRKLSGKAGIDEVMAATVLTSLSTSPLVLGHPPATPTPEPSSEVWKEVPAMSSSCSSSSNTSGDWRWDPPSDRSTHSTPSPPLSSHVPSTFLPTPLPDDGPDEPDGTHFVFGEPIPRKRKNSTKVMFKCLWKSCGKVLSSSSGMQKHIRTMHLGRKADLEQSDGEEDFYYTELDVDVDSLDGHGEEDEPDVSLLQNSTKVMFKCLWKSCGKVLSSSSGMQKHIRTMHLGRKADLEQSDGEEDFYYTELDVDVDSLTDGLSSLTPVSPTSSVPPAFPGPEVQGPVPLPIPDLALASPSVPPGLCHVHTDHAYQWGRGCQPDVSLLQNSTKVMFKCLWKSCGKVLSSSSGMQKHIRTMHLGRKADLEQSDGEEDFYYTELDVDVDSLTDGLSSLTPVSPTSSVPPAFPGPEVQGPVPLPIPDLALASPSVPPGLCHVHTDHAYQGCPAPPRPPVPPTVRPRGEAKKCRKVYGMENREMWCTACRWKKACQRFLD
ncbi:PREDICTED: SLC2A4 regulator [Calidris pugnax]|uniref:SLC2A4 regulator n=1 Tax=Calidris pugnax TaxID=198806 RepID=UPI00071E4C96|nr:PREDICTED: SLC2A4 regulator [Calidris pugnax]